MNNAKEFVDRVREVLEEISVSSKEDSKQPNKVTQF